MRKLYKYQILCRYCGHSSFIDNLPRRNIVTCPACKNRGRIIIANPTILTTIGSAAITGAGVALGFKGVDYITKRIGKQRS